MNANQISFSKNLKLIDEWKILFKIHFFILISAKIAILIKNLPFFRNGATDAISFFMKQLSLKINIKYEWPLNTFKGPVFRFRHVAPFEKNISILYTNLLFTKKEQKLRIWKEFPCTDSKFFNQKKFSSFFLIYTVAQVVLSFYQVYSKDWLNANQTSLSKNLKVFACVNAKKNMSIDKSFWNSIEKVLGHQVFASVKAKKTWASKNRFQNW